MKKILIFLLILIGAQASAQQPENSPNFSPYTVIYNFNEGMYKNPENSKLAGESFMKNDTIKRSDLAIKFKKILDGKGIQMDSKKVPNEPDYVDSTTKLHIYQPFTSENKIYIERVKGQWYFSEETVQSLDEMYNDIYVVKVHTPSYFKGPFWQKKFFGITLAEWLSLIILIVLCFLAYKIVNYVSSFIFRRYSQRRLDYNADIENYITKVSRVLALFVVCELFMRYLPSLQLPVSWNSFLIKAIGISSVIFFVLFINRMLDAIAYIIKYKKEFSEKFNDQVLPILTRLIKIVNWVIGIFYILYNYLNVEPTALLAGISIGGIALALAAQDTVKNFLGSAIILIDKPFQVNDWIIYKEYEGIVEEIGIRSTRIRSFEDSIIYVPNSLLSTDVVNNNGLRKFRRFKTFLGVEYKTSPEKINEYVDALVKLIKQHPDTVKYNYQVHLFNLSDSSIDIMFSCFFSVKDTTEELYARGQMLNEILKLSRDMDVQFAFPSRSIYMEAGDNYGTTEMPNPPAANT